MKRYTISKQDLVDYCFTKDGTPKPGWSEYAAKMHPTDRAEAFREIERGFGNWAKRQEAENERVGVPEREQVQP